MSSDESMDELLRRTLKRHPVPVCPAASTDEIVRRVTKHESARRRRGRRALMIVYWVAFAVGAGWMMRSLPLPKWTPEALTPELAWLIPCAGALLVWSRSIVRFIHSLGVRP